MYFLLLLFFISEGNKLSARNTKCNEKKEKKRKRGNCIPFLSAIILRMTLCVEIYKLHINGVV